MVLYLAIKLFACLLTGIGDGLSANESVYLQTDRSLYAAGDTLSASVITASRKQAHYRPERTVGPYSSVFDWRQVKLREELQPYDDMDLMTHISATWTGLFCTTGEDGIGAGRAMYTTRGGRMPGGRPSACCPSAGSARNPLRSGPTFRRSVPPRCTGIPVYGQMQTERSGFLSRRISPMFIFGLSDRRQPGSGFPVQR